MAKATKYDLERQLAQAEQSLDAERARGAVLVGRVAELEAMVKALQSSTETIRRLTSPPAAWPGVVVSDVPPLSWSRPSYTTCVAEKVIVEHPKYSSFEPVHTSLSVH